MSSRRYLRGDDVAKLVEAARDGVDPNSLNVATQRHIRVRRYDFARPVKLTPEQQQQVKRIFESFARRLGTRLSGHLRSLATVELLDVAQVSWSDAVGAIQQPSVTCVVHQDPGDGPALLAMDMKLGLRFVDRLLGGSRTGADTPMGSRTSLTDIELKLVAYTLEHVVDELSQSWSAVVPLTYTLGDLRADRQHSLIAAPGDPAIGVTMNVMIEGEANMLWVALPWRTIAGIADELARGYGSDESSLLNDVPIREGLGEVDVDVRVEVADTSMTLADLAQLRPGQVLKFDQPVADGVSVWIENAKCYEAIPGRDQDWRVVQVVEPVKDED